jgi:hypothetical protein
MEYDRLQASIDKYDDQRFKIKGWAITAAGALFAFGVNMTQPALVAVGALLVLFFGYLEVMTMGVQAAVIARSNEVEGLLESARRDGVGPEHDAYVFGIGKVFVVPFLVRSVPRLIRHRKHITSFYAGLTVAMVAGAILLAVIR